jgi:hypothetical protein
MSVAVVSFQSREHIEYVIKIKFKLKNCYEIIDVTKYPATLNLQKKQKTKKKL